MVLPIVAAFYFATTLGALALAPIALAAPQVIPNANDIVGNHGIQSRNLEKRLTIEAPLGTFKLGLRALIGDPVCPALTGPGVNARVFAAVTLAERATLDTTVHLLGPSLHVTAALEATVKVCLCVEASVANNVVNIPANVNAQAKADIVATGSAVANTLLQTALGLIGNSLHVDLAPISSAPCSCPANAIPTCNLGQCGCQACPPNHIYDPATGSCVVSCPPATFPSCSGVNNCQCLPCPVSAQFDNVLGVCVCLPGLFLNDDETACVPSPSGGAERRVRRRSVGEGAYTKRQTSRKQIVERMQAKQIEA